MQPHVEAGVAGPGVSVDALSALYLQHYAALVRLAALLLDEPAAREDVVQEAYVRVAAVRSRLREPDSALAYLRRTVVNLSRSQLRRRLVADRFLRRQPPPGEVSDGAEALVQRDQLLAALRALPRRQREAVALRYYADMSEQQAAAVMGISVGAVKSNTSRGLAAMARTLEVTR